MINLNRKTFYYAKDGYGEPTSEIKIEQDFVTASFSELKNMGRFVNDRIPGSISENHEEEIIADFLVNTIFIPPFYYHLTTPFIVIL